MSIVLLVYLASVVETFKCTLGWLSVVLVFLYLFLTDFLRTARHAKMVFTGLVIMFFTAVLIPSEKTIYIMAGASIAQDIANSPKTAATMDKVYKIIDSKLEEQLSAAADAVSKKAEKKIEEAVK